MTPGYELLYLITSTKSQEEVNQIIEAVNQLLAKEKAEVLRHKVWSQRQLAYPIKKVEHAFFVLCYFKADGEVLGKVNRSVLLQSDVLRHVIVQHKDIDAEIQMFTAPRPPKETRTRKVKETVQVKPGVVRPADEAVEKEDKKLPKAVSLALEQAKAEEKDQPKEEIRTDSSSAEGEKGAEDKPTKPKKSSLVDLDKKLEDILGGDIEL